MIIKIFATVLLSLFILQSNAQALKVGDKVPDAMLASIYNYKKSKGQLLTEFGNKPLILDFWTTHCVPCIGMMPILDSLKRSYKNQFEVLMITAETKNLVNKFYAQQPDLAKLQIPTVTDDNLLHKFFPHQGVPHYVWLDKNGYILAQTSLGEVRSKTALENFIAGRKLNVEEAKRPVPSNVLFGGLPFWNIDQEYNEGSNIIEYSIFTRYLAQIKAYIPQNAKRIAIANAYPKDIILRSFSDNEKKLHQVSFLADNQFICDSGFLHKYGSSGNDNKFCYDLVLNITDSATLFKRVKKDVSEFFNVNTKFENRQVTAIVLKRIAGIDVLSSKSSDTTSVVVRNKNTYYTKRKWGDAFGHRPDAPGFYGYLSYQYRMPVIDETGFDRKKLVDYYRIPFTDESTPENKKRIDQWLKELGLQITIEKRLLPVLVIETRKDESTSAKVN